MAISKRHAREIRAGINSVRVPYKAGGCPKHGYFSNLDLRTLYALELEASRFAGSRLYEAARARAKHRTVERQVPCWECR